MGEGAEFPMTNPQVPSVEPVSRLATGFSFLEGPVWLKDHQALLFTDIPGNSILRWRSESRVDVWLSASHFAIGLSRRFNGDVLCCEHVTRSLTALGVAADGSHDGTRTVLARGVAGVPLNSTNDVIECPDGTILFTDPAFGVRVEDGELHGYEQAMERSCDVLSVTDDADNAAVYVTGVHRPNGLCLSPNGGTLYITDSSTRFHRVLVVEHPGAPAEPLWTMPVGVPDGIVTDSSGFIWVAGGDGVYLLSPDGEQVGHIPVPEMVSNLCFGGADGHTLFITATSSLYSARTSATG